MANSTRITDLETYATSNDSRITNLEGETQPVNRGGTGLTGYTTGDILFAADQSNLNKLSIGSVNAVIRSSGLIPYWDELQVNSTNNYYYINVVTQWVQRGNDIDGTSGSKSGYSVALSSNGDIMAIGEPGIGAVKIFKWYNDTWNSYGNISGNVNDGSGTSIALSSDGHVLAIGSPYNSMGYVKVYSWTSGTTWSQVGSTIQGNGLRFGFSISLSSDGTILAIGKPGDDYDIDGLSTDVGEVKVYSLSGSQWSQLGSSITGGQGEFTGFCVSLSSSGNVLAIGEPRNNIVYRGGSVRIFEYVNNSWVQKGNTLYGINSGNQHGFALNLSGVGNDLVVGSPFVDDNGIQSGQVVVYRWNTESWVQKGVNIDGILAGDRFGNSVALSNNGETLIAGSILSDELYVDAGQIRVFEWSGTTWSQVGYSVNGESAGDNSGTSVAISNDGVKIAIGAPFNNTNFGHVRVFMSEIISSDRNYDSQILELNSNIEDLRISNLNVHFRLDTNDSRINNIDNRVTVIENNDIVTYSSGINSGFSRGDIIVGTAINTLDVLSLGSVGQVLKSDGNDIYWGDEDTSGGTSGDTLRDVTGNGNEADVTVRFLNQDTSIDARGNVIVQGDVQAAFFKGDGGLLSNTNVTPTLHKVVNYGGNVTSNTIQLTNSDISLVAAGRIEASSYIGDGTSLSGVALVTDLTQNSQRISTLETKVSLPILSNSENITTGFNKGDIIYCSSTHNLSRLTIGNNGEILTVNSDNIPEWASLSSTGTSTITTVGGNTGISNTSPQYTLHVGSNVVVDDIGTEVLRVDGNIYTTMDVLCLNAVRSPKLFVNKLFVGNSEVVAERPLRKIRLN